MMGSVDGRIQGERWKLAAAAESQYEAVHALHHPDAWMCGRQTFQVDFLEQKKPAIFSRRATVPAGDYIPAPAPRSGRGKPVYAIAVDAGGKLRWPSNEMRGDRLVVLTTKAAPSGYLADLREKSIPYLIGGDTEIRFASVLARLGRLFGIRKIMLEGGGSLNGALLAAGLINEISLLVSPFADGARDVPTVFDAPPRAGRPTPATALQLRSATTRPGGLVWLRYTVKSARS